MNFNKHSDLVGQHAFLTPSKYHWINYDEEKLVSTFSKYMAIQKGTELHETACRCIRDGIQVANKKKAIYKYINDAIGYRMTPEQPLFYSENAFGTADAICFRNDMLRIHDLKTGVSPVSMHQLEIYAALFCLEYRIKPVDISIELRLYQDDNILVHQPFADDIQAIMDKIILFDKTIEKLRMEEES